MEEGGEKMAGKRVKVSHVTTARVLAGVTTFSATFPPRNGPDVAVLVTVAYICCAYINSVACLLNHSP